MIIVREFTKNVAHSYTLCMRFLSSGPEAKSVNNAPGPRINEVRPFCWTDLTIRLIVMGPVLNRAHSVQLFLDPILVVVTQIFIKFFQEVLD